MKTYLEYKDEKSNKFWEIIVDGVSHTVRYGKVDSNGTSKTKTFEDEEKAQKDADKLIKAKTKKGYKVSDLGDNVASVIKPKTPILLKDRRTYSIEDIKEQLIFLENQSSEDIQNFLEKHNGSIDFEGTLEGDFYIYVGDLNIVGDFMFGQQLLVIGDLNVKGTLNNNAGLYVTGTVRAEHFIIEDNAITYFAHINGLVWHGVDYTSDIGGWCFVEINDGRYLEDTCSSSAYYGDDDYDDDDDDDGDDDESYEVESQFVEEICNDEGLNKKVLSEFLEVNKPIFLFREQNEYKRSPTYGEYIDVATHKFWGINTEGKLQNIVTGIIGEKGTSRTKNFTSEDEAEADQDHLISRQNSRGYQFFRASCAILECLEWFDTFYKFDFEVCRSLDTAVMAKLNKEYSFSSAKNTSEIYYIELTGKSHTVKLELNHDAPALIHSIIEDLILGKENTFCTYIENKIDEVDTPTVVSTYNNLSIVEQKGLFGIIDSENNTVLDITYCGYTKIKVYDGDEKVVVEHRIILELENEDTERTYGLYDFNLRRFILEPIYSQISFTEFKIVVVEGGKRKFASTCNYVKNSEGLWASFNDDGPNTNFQYILVGILSDFEEYFFVHKSDRLWEVLNSESFDFKNAKISRYVGIEFEVVFVEKENKMMGALSLTGELVIPFEFSKFSCDDTRGNLYIKGVVNDKYTYFTAKGEKTLDYRDGDYLEICGYPSCNRVEVRKDEDYYGIINIHSGEPLIPFIKDMKVSLSDHLDYFEVNTIVGSKWGVIDTSGNYILQPVYDFVHFKDNILYFRKGDLCKSMFLNTKEIIAVAEDFNAVDSILETDKIIPRKDECVMVKKDGKWSEYRSEFYSFKRNKDYLWRVFDKSGNQKVDYEYTRVKVYNNSTGIFMINEEWRGVYSSKHSKFILEVKYKKIFSPDDEYAYMTKKDGKWSEYVCPTSHYFVKNTEGLWGVFDKEGKQENAFEFDEIIKQKPGMNVVILTVNDKAGAVSFTGEVKIPFEYYCLELEDKDEELIIVGRKKTNRFAKQTKFDINGDIIL